MKEEIFVSCAPGLEPMLEAELRELELPIVDSTAGGVTLEGSPRTMMRANLESGLAQQVLLRVARFRTKRLPDLRKRFGSLPWAQWLRPSLPVRFRISSKKSRLYHTGAIEQRAREAIEQSVGELPAQGESEQQVHIRAFRDEFVVSLDTSGAPLHRRGYRLASAKAPLREDLARALVRASGWDSNQRLVDPMMGSGTILIEAAMMARRLPPGRLRKFAFEEMPSHDSKQWEALRTAASTRVLSDVTLEIHGSDRDAGAWRAAISNAERAGVGDALTLGCAALSSAPGLLAPLPHNGSLVTNPPYGNRVGKDVTALYQRLGQIVRALPEGWTTTLVGPYPKLIRQLATPMRSLLMTEHGGTKIRYYRSQR